MIRAAIFDLDGTLIDSLPGIAAGLNLALQAHGLPPHPEERVQTFIGNGSRMLVRRGIGGEPDEQLVEDVHRDFFPAYSESWRGGTSLYPGIRELLEDLAQAGLPLAVFSNKPHRYTTEIVQEFFARIPWVMILGQRQGLPRKPNPAGALLIAEKLALPPAEIAFVGDSSIDYQTAGAAGMQPVLVTWGFQPLEQLKAMAAPLMNSAAELRKYLQEPHPDA